MMIVDIIDEDTKRPVLGCYSVLQYFFIVYWLYLYNFDVGPMGEPIYL